MIYIRVEDPGKFKDNLQRWMGEIRDIVSDKVLGKLAEDNVTTMTTNIIRQKDIDGKILKKNSEATIQKKLERGPRFGKSLIGKGLAKKTGRQAKSLVDFGLLQKPSTYEVVRVSKSKYEIRVRAIKTGHEEDTVTRDKVAPMVQAMGYKFFGLPKLIGENVARILRLELQKAARVIR